jgi:hypothetical protein
MKWCLAAFCAATLFHHVHNAAFLEHYPNMPAWLTPAWAYVVWLAATALGFGGYVLLRRGFRRTGQAILVLYAAWGFDGLTHYALAPVSAHTLTMNASIWLEAVTGALLLVAVIASPRAAR